MPVINGHDIRALILDIIAAQNPNNLQQNPVFTELKRRLRPNTNIAYNPTEPEQQIILTEWGELFRTGYLSWGHNLDNPDSPFFHLTAAGGAALASRARDPINPDGYLNHVDGMADIDDVCRSYLQDALRCYVADVPRAASVMLGAAAERLVLNIRDKVVARIQRADPNAAVPAALTDWRVRTVMAAVERYIDDNDDIMDHQLHESFDAHWASFGQQIRAVRNEAGHPQTIDPITRDTAHAGFLVFPELAAIADRLGEALDAEQAG